MKKLLIVLCSLSFSCAATPETKKENPVEEKKNSEAPKSQPTSEPMSGAESGLSSDRIGDSKKRLQASPGGQIILAAIEKAGGLEPWFSNPLHFRFNYMPLAGRPPIDTRQVIDTRSARARHLVFGSADDFGKGGVELGWTGNHAWSKGLAEDSKINPRFWSLTPYYFVGVPFVLADPGVILTLEGEETLNGKLCDVVRVTFEADTGDAPDDYYVVYVDKTSNAVAGLRYVVSYKGFFPDGGQTPEKIMVYGDPIEANGLRFATTYNTFKWDVDAKKKGDLVTKIVASDIKFAPVESSFFEIPEGAKTKDGF